MPFPLAPELDLTSASTFHAEPAHRPVADCCPCLGLHHHHFILYPDGRGAIPAAGPEVTMPASAPVASAMILLAPA